jgi:hypothetical protein
MPALKQSWLNLLADAKYRGQALSFPANWYIGLFNVMPSRSAAGTELSVGGGYTGYARVAVASSLANWSGTQSDGSTSASSGTRDYISNNVAISFSASLAAAWNNIVAFGLFDAASGGNHREWGSIVDLTGAPITISREIGAAMVFAPSELRLYLR